MYCKIGLEFPPGFEILYVEIPLYKYKGISTYSISNPGGGGAPVQFCSTLGYGNVSVLRCTIRIMINCVSGFDKL